MPPSGIGGGTGAGQKRKVEDADHAPISMTKVQPYNPRDEQAPKSVTLSKDWQTFMNGKKKVRALLLQPMKMCEYRDPIVEGLINTINDRIIKFEEQKITIGVVGAMGSGKSSMLNSIYQAGMIAREGDSGDSCTLVTHIYQDRIANQQAPFLADVHFLNRAERSATMKSYLRLYFKASTASDDDDDDGIAAYSGDDEQEDFNVKEHIAKAMVALFSDHEECSTSTSAKHFLERADCEDDEDILAKLEEWAETLMEDACGRNNHIYVTASTGPELLEKLQIYSVYMEDEDGELAQSLWPFVSHINIHFEDPITRLGVAVVDSPGTTDANKVRRHVAQELRKLRTHAILVADVARAKDDPAIAREMRLMKSKGPGRVVIALPKSDRIGENTKLEGSRREKDTVTSLRNQVTKYDNDLNATNRQLSATKSDSERGALHAKSYELEVRLKLAQNAEKAYRINLRSAASERSLQDTYRSITGHSSPVTVLSISNTTYAEHRAGYYPKQTPVLSLEESKIPELRRFIYSAPNEVRKNEAKHQQEVSLPGLFSLINLYTNRTVMACKADLEEHVKMPLDKCECRINDSFRRLQGEVIGEITSQIKMEEVGWLEKAEKLCNVWARVLNSAQHLQVMNRDGRRAARGKTTEINMTANLIGIKSPLILQLFRKATIIINNFEKYMLSEVNQLHSDMIEKIEDDDRAHFVLLQPFIDYVGKEKGRLKTAVRKSSSRLLNIIGAVQDNLGHDTENSYLVQIMLPIYAETAKFKGSKGATKVARPKGGWPNFRKNHFKKAVCKQPGLFKEACELAESQLIEALQKEKETLTGEIKKIFEDYLKGFDTMCAAKANDDPAEKQLRELLKKALELAEQHLNGPMLQAVEGLTRNF